MYQQHSVTLFIDYLLISWQRDSRKELKFSRPRNFLRLYNTAVHRRVCNIRSFDDILHQLNSLHSLTQPISLTCMFTSSYSLRLGISRFLFLWYFRHFSSVSHFIPCVLSIPASSSYVIFSSNFLLYLIPSKYSPRHLHIHSRIFILCYIL
jgi:hypothetical protein